MSFKHTYPPIRGVRSGSSITSACTSRSPKTEGSLVASQNLVIITLPSGLLSSSIGPGSALHSHATQIELRHLKLAPIFQACSRNSTSLILAFMLRMKRLKSQRMVLNLSPVLDRLVRFEPSVQEISPFTPEAPIKASRAAGTAELVEGLDRDHRAHDDENFQADAHPAATPARGHRTACIACAPAGKPRSPWPPNRICPCPITRRSAGLRAGTRPQTLRTRGKLWPDRGGAPGSLDRPGCWTRDRSSRTSPRSGCTWPPRARQPGRCRATPPQCAGSPPATCSARPERPAGTRWTPATSSTGWCNCSSGTAAPTPASSSGRCGSSSSGGPVKKTRRTR